MPNCAKSFTKRPIKWNNINAFSKWLSFGNDGKIKALTAEESEKHMKYIDLLANAVILDNTFQQSKVLQGLIEVGWSITPDELAMLSPSMIHHVKRSGSYVSAAPLLLAS